MLARVVYSTVQYDITTLSLLGIQCVYIYKFPSKFENEIEIMAGLGWGSFMRPTPRAMLYATPTPPPPLLLSCCCNLKDGAVYTIHASGGSKGRAAGATAP